MIVRLHIYVDIIYTKKSTYLVQTLHLVNHHLCRFNSPFLLHPSATFLTCIHNIYLYKFVSNCQGYNDDVRNLNELLVSSVEINCSYLKDELISRPKHPPMNSCI